LRIGKPSIADFGLRIADLFENAKNWKKFVFIGNGFIFIFFLTGFTGWTGFFHGFHLLAIANRSGEAGGNRVHKISN